MAEVKIFHDREGQTLTVWFTDPSLEHVAEETGDEVVLMKDRSGRVIGFEKLNFSIPESDSVHAAVETAPASKVYLSHLAQSPSGRPSSFALRVRRPFVKRLCPRRIRGGNASSGTLGCCQVPDRSCRRTQEATPCSRN